MKTIYKNLGKIFAFFTCLIIAQQASATLLSVPYYAQRSFFADADTNHLNNLSQWCWDASSEMVLNTPLSASYPGTFYDQDTIAAYGSQGSNYWNYIFGSAPRQTNAGVIQPALNGIDLILKNFGPLNSRAFYRALTSAELQTEMDAGRPCVARLGWCNSPTNVAYVNNGGGHFVVLYGFDGTTININDPWPDNGPLMQSYATFSPAAGSIYVNPKHSRFKWTHTLTLGASLDVVFLIDTTGSMEDSIDSVKAAAIQIMTNLFAHFPDARIAVKDFKDMPRPLYADGGSTYLDEIDTPFTTNAAAVQAGVNPLFADGGGDEPEALYSALMYTLNNTSWSGGSLGGWRTNPTPRIIIVATDAPGHDPREPWAGGFSISDVIAKATTPGKEISIYGLAAGFDAVADLSALASGTGGAEFDTSYAGVADAITNVINLVSASTRHPQGAVSIPKPTFTFNVGNIGMAGVPTGYTIQILKSNETTHAWALYLETPITGSTFTPGSPLPLGTYEWRLGAKQPASTILSPAGGTLSTVPAGLVYENAYTEFERILSTVTSSPTLLSPSEFFTSSSPSFKKSPQASTGSVTFVFGTSGASSYVVTINIFDSKSHAYKAWKTLTVKPPAKDPTAATLSVTVSGLNSSLSYSWSVTSVTAF